MTICHYCKQDIDRAKACNAPSLAGPKGRPYARVRYGDEERREVTSEGRCPDCRVVVGMYHHPGCVTEECPVCHELFIGCGCPLVIENTSVPAGNAAEAAGLERAISEKAPGIRLGEAPLPTWSPTVQQQRDALDALRLGQLAGCWRRSDCSVTISHGYLRHECAGEVDVISVLSGEDVGARLRAKHAAASMPPLTDGQQG